ncbi:MAG TPA: alpha-1,2-fucosyltransferase [Candidatus Gastranaerophilales bacterium]|nr:alpha-1,2-fucosyltransferase [Candidatus Gastranaerophilales bacterium]
MIIVNILGGIGNQMFQYALGKHLATKHNTQVKLDLTGFEEYKLHKYRLNVLNLEENVASLEEIEAIKYKKLNFISKAIYKIKGKKNTKPSKSYILEKQFPFDPEILTLPDNVYLEGYWQTEKYFKEISQVIKKDFGIKNELCGKNKEFAEQINDSNSISLHIRRGDYVKDAKTKAAHYVDLDEYYKNAINLIKERVSNPHFYIFSDDPEWAKANYAGDSACSIVDFNSADNGYEDLRLMSLCKHNITANSSFSWWGAWLNNNPDKIVIAPQKWFNDPQKDPKDLQPDGWIKL